MDKETNECLMLDLSINFKTLETDLIYGTLSQKI